MPGAGLGSQAAAELTAELVTVVRAMTAHDRALGVEASLAQGLKHAARRYPPERPLSLVASRRRPWPLLR